MRLSHRCPRLRSHQHRRVHLGPAERESGLQSADEYQRDRNFGGQSSSFNLRGDEPILLLIPPTGRRDRYGGASLAGEHFPGRTICHWRVREDALFRHQCGDLPRSTRPRHPILLLFKNIAARQQRQHQQYQSRPGPMRIRRLRGRFAAHRYIYLGAGMHSRGYRRPAGVAGICD
jgi:hypothetical protein